VRQLTEHEIPYCVFGGAAASFFGVTRPIGDIDLLLGVPDVERMAALFPDAERVGANGLSIAPLELWCAPLSLSFGDVTRELDFDAALSARRTRRQLGGVPVWCAPVEDLIVIKAILQREGRHDMSDIFAMLSANSKALDVDYLRQRARACDAEGRVFDCIASVTRRISG
jgi:hypothetical protein